MNTNNYSDNCNCLMTKANLCNTCPFKRCTMIFHIAFNKYQRQISSPIEFKKVLVHKKFSLSHQGKEGEDDYARRGEGQSK